MTRQEQIEEAAKIYAMNYAEVDAYPNFLAGAQWADANPIEIPKWLETEGLMLHIKDLEHDHKIMKEALEFYINYEKIKIKAWWALDDDKAKLATELIQSFWEPFTYPAKEALSKLKVK